MTARRFPPPWFPRRIQRRPLFVRDNNGQQLAYAYYEDESARRSAAKLLTKDEVRREYDRPYGASQKRFGRLRLGAA
jgi:hypothetical protein